MVTSQAGSAPRSAGETIILELPFGFQFSLAQSLALREYDRESLPFYPTCFRIVVRAKYLNPCLVFASEISTE